MWEYLIQSYDFLTYQQTEKMDELGAVGWELVCVLPYTGSARDEAKYIFKRPARR